MAASRAKIQHCTIWAFCKSSIGKKVIMGLAGLAWSLFVMVHMAGNLLMFVSPESYNRYGDAIVHSPFIYIAESGLLLTIAIHAWTGIALTLRNRCTKPQKYAVSANHKKGASLASKSMIYSGSITLVFVILHLITFKFGPHYSVVYNGVEVRDLYKLVIEVFQNPFYVAWYIFCLVLVGVHLYHGVSSSFQTLGISHPRYTPYIKKFGYLYAFVVALGFISQPLFVVLAR